MDTLVNDPNIGGVLVNYMPKERVRTYIKDAILNAYTKVKVREIQQANDPIQIIHRVYDVEQPTFQYKNDIVACYSFNEKVFIIGSGTVLKWETALRKALEFIARTPQISAEGLSLSICLKLAVINDDITEGDRTQITNALAAVGVQVCFCVA